MINHGKASVAVVLCFAAIVLPNGNLVPFYKSDLDLLVPKNTGWRCWSDSWVPSPGYTLSCAWDNNYYCKGMEWPLTHAVVLHTPSSKPLICP